MNRQYDKDTGLKEAPPFKQIAVSTGNFEAPDVLYGLDADGRVWVRVLHLSLPSAMNVEADR